MSIKYSIILISLLCTFSSFSQWEQLNDAPFETDHSNGFGFNGKGYVIKGTPNNNGGQFQNEIWEYDPQLDFWERLGFANIPARDIAIGDDMDGKYYFGFGRGLNDL